MLQETNSKHEWPQEQLLWLETSSQLSGLALSFILAMSVYWWAADQGGWWFALAGVALILCEGLKLPRVAQALTRRGARKLTMTLHRLRQRLQGRELPLMAAMTLSLLVLGARRRALLPVHFTGHVGFLCRVLQFSFTLLAAQIMLTVLLANAPRVALALAQGGLLIAFCLAGIVSLERRQRCPLQAAELRQRMNLYLLAATVSIALQYSASENHIFLATAVVPGWLVLSAAFTRSGKGA